jgi:hypothetical protein
MGTCCFCGGTLEGDRWACLDCQSRMRDVVHRLACIRLLPHWPEIRHWANERFGTLACPLPLLSRLRDWFLAEHCTNRVAADEFLALDDASRGRFLVELLKGRPPGTPTAAPKSEDEQERDRIAARLPAGRVRDVFRAVWDRGKIADAADVERDVWGPENVVGQDNIRTTVSRLRTALVRARSKWDVQLTYRKAEKTITLYTLQS